MATKSGKKQRGGLPLPADIGALPLDAKAAAKLEGMVQRALKESRIKEEWYRRAVDQDFRLQVLFPNEYVVYRDTWKGRGKKRIRVRTILGHARTFDALWDILERDRLHEDPDENIACY
jgi:hypothetical protein